MGDELLLAFVVPALVLAQIDLVALDQPCNDPLDALLVAILAGANEVVVGYV